MIFCFSGTGNSRYISRRIAEATQDTVVDLNRKIKEKDYSPLQTGSDVIVIAPTYAWRLPHIVSEWLERTELSGAERVWFVMDCGGEIGNAARYNCLLAEQKHLRYMGTAQIIMPENYIAMFNAPQVAEAAKIVEKAEPDIVKVIKSIQAEQEFQVPRNNLYDRIMSRIVNPIFYRVIVKSAAFRAKDTCTTCGQCVKNCPLNNIKLGADGKPVWGGDCTHCMACICYCPAEAIEYGKKSIGKPRYHFEGLRFK